MRILLRFILGTRPWRLWSTGSDDQTEEDAGQKKLPLNCAFSPSRVALHFFVDGSNRRAQGQLRSFHKVGRTHDPDIKAAEGAGKTPMTAQGTCCTCSKPTVVVYYDK